MAETPEYENEREVLAGEYALGVLEGAERSAAQRLVLSDRDFGELVRWWEHRLACMAEIARSVEVDPQVWPAIERRIVNPEAQPIVSPALPARAVPGLSGGRLAAALGAVAAAAAAITFIVISPQRVEQLPTEVPIATSETRLIAQLQSEDGSISLAGIVEPQAGTLSLNIAGLAPQSGSAPELWVVPADGVPRSLGEIPDSGTFSRGLSGEERALLVPGSALAVTYEESGTIPNTAPTTDILVVGALSEV